MGIMDKVKDVADQTGRKFKKLKNAATRKTKIKAATHALKKTGPAGRQVILKHLYTHIPKFAESQKDLFKVMAISEELEKEPELKEVPALKAGDQMLKAAGKHQKKVFDPRFKKMGDIYLLKTYRAVKQHEKPTNGKAKEVYEEWMDVLEKYGNKSS